MSSLTNVSVLNLTIIDATREILPSIAIAIAEGNLDPITMEAFDYFPSQESHLELTVTQTSKEIAKPEVTSESTEKSCFMMFSSHETREESTCKFVSLIRSS